MKRCSELFKEHLRKWKFIIFHNSVHLSYSLNSWTVSPKMKPKTEDFFGYLNGNRMEEDRRKEMPRKCKRWPLAALN